MPNEFVETQYVTTIRNKQGKVVETVVSKTLPFRSRSATAERRKKQEVIDMLQERVDKYEIGWAFANHIATLVKNYKKNPRAKRTRTRHFIAQNDSQMRFKQTAATDLNKLRLLRDIIQDPSRFCIVEEHVAKLKEDLNTGITLYVGNWPREALDNKYLRDVIPTNKLLMKRWYENWRMKYSNSASGAQTSLEDKCKFFLEKVKEAGYGN